MEIFNDMKGNACIAISSVYDNMGCDEDPTQPMCPILEMVKDTVNCEDDNIIM